MLVKLLKQNEHIINPESVIYNLLQLEFSGKALCNSIDEVGEREGATTIPVSEKEPPYYC